MKTLFSRESWESREYMSASNSILICLSRGLSRAKIGTRLAKPRRWLTIHFLFSFRISVLFSNFAFSFVGYRWQCYFTFSAPRRLCHASLSEAISILSLQMPAESRQGSENCLKIRCCDFSQLFNVFLIRSTESQLSWRCQRADVFVSYATISNCVISSWNYIVFKWQYKCLIGMRWCHFQE